MLLCVRFQVVGTADTKSQVCGFFKKQHRSQCGPGSSTRGVCTMKGSGGHALLPLSEVSVVASKPNSGRSQIVGVYFVTSPPALGTAGSMQQFSRF